jgi:hypothetical protein
MRTRVAKSERAAIATICSRSAHDSLFRGTVSGSHRPSWELSPLKRSLGNTDYLTPRVLAHHARRSRPPTARVHDPTQSLCAFASVPPSSRFFWRIHSAAASANALSFPKISRFRRRWSLHVIFVTRRPCLKMFKTLCEPGRGLSGIQAFASQL